MPKMNNQQLSQAMGGMNFYERVGNALYETDPKVKCQKVDQLYADLIAGKIAPFAANDLTEILPAGRPETPVLINPQDVPRRGLGSKEGVLALIHAIGHIEFNGINLGLDAAYRFRNMPAKFYDAWILVAKDESKVFS